MLDFNHLMFRMLEYQFVVNILSILEKGLLVLRCLNVIGLKNFIL